MTNPSSSALPDWVVATGKKIVLWVGIFAVVSVAYFLLVNVAMWLKLLDITYFLLFVVLITSVFYLGVDSLLKSRHISELEYTVAQPVSVDLQPVLDALDIHVKAFHLSKPDFGDLIRRLEELEKFNHLLERLDLERTLDELGTGADSLKQLVAGVQDTVTQLVQRLGNVERLNLAELQGRIEKLEQLPQLPAGLDLAALKQQVEDLAQKVLAMEQLDLAIRLQVLEQVATELAALKNRVDTFEAGQSQLAAAVAEIQRKVKK